MSATFHFARGADFDALSECRAWRSRGPQGRDEMAMLMGRLALINDYGAGSAAGDRWSPPDLYLYRSGSASGIFSVKPDGPDRAQTLLLLVADLTPVRDTKPIEAEARRRLRATRFLED